MSSISLLQPKDLERQRCAFTSFCLISFNVTTSSSDVFKRNIYTNLVLFLPPSNYLGGIL